MKKEFKYYGIVWLVLVVIFNVIVFVTPSDINGQSKFTGSFWVGYIFIMLTFMGQLVVAYYSFKGNATQTFYRLPMISISYITLIVMIGVGVLCMVIPKFPVWLGIILCLLVLAFSVIALVSAQAAASTVDNLDKKIKAQTFFVKSLTVDVDMLMQKATSEGIRNEIKKLYETVRYSDPMTNDALIGLETQITLKVAEISEKIGEDEVEVIGKLCKDAILLLKERNKKCMLLK